MVEGRTAESFYYAPLRISCREAFSGKRIHEEIYTLRFGRGSNAKGGASGESGCLNRNRLFPKWVGGPGLASETWVFRSAIRSTKQKAVEGCTLVRTWSTPEDLWDLREFV
jgi:hypothetical protein